MSIHVCTCIRKCTYTLATWVATSVYIYYNICFATEIIIKSTKVLNPRLCIMRVHEKYASAYTRNTHAVQIRMLYRYAARVGVKPGLWTLDWVDRWTGPLDRLMVSRMRRA